ncbi:MAG: aspartyl/asparaginyl beta-hydroxylase domain-containing protein [Alphaproteobacteria bacterium]|nr:MAG: aspartyl/asparaginyl beta-hydroxylase domain-containing protein [Alphaproteobacteria bacterium]
MPTHAETLPDRIRLPIDFDPKPLAADLERFEPADWTRHYVRDNYEGEWSAVPLRAAAGETHPLRMIGVHSSDKGFIDTLYLDRAPALRAALSQFHCPLKAVRLMRLGAGSIIKEHDDHDPEAERGAARLHVPITTNPEVEFLLNRSPVPMTPGSAWYLRLSDPHSVANRGASDRVHLVIDTWRSDWLDRMLHAGAARAA